MKNFYRTPHFWLILLLMILGALFYYSDRVPFIENIVATWPLQFFRYSTYRILSLTPVAYAAFVFGWRAGAATAVIVGFALLPRALMNTVQAETISETIAFFFIGLLVTWLIHRQQRSVQQLETTKEELQANVAVIRENENRLTALNRLSSTISNTLDLNTILNNAIDTVVGVMPADAAWIYVIDRDEQVLRLATSREVPEELARGISTLKMGEGLNGLVAQTGEPLYVADAAEDPRLTRDVVAKFKVRSTLIVPITSKQSVNGTLCIAMFHHRVFEQRETELLTAMGNQIGIALENARLYREQQQSEEQYRGIFENSSDALFVCATNGRIISVNAATQQLTGFNQEELTGTVIHEIFTGPMHEKIRKLFYRNPDRIPRGSIGEATIMRKGGTQAFVELKTSPIVRKDQFTGVQIIAQDVTEEKRLRQNMEYYIKQVTRAQEDERLRIARELHDDTAQLLANLSRGINSVVSGEGTCTTAVLDQLRKLQGMADGALEGVRRFSQDLRPSILDDLGLVPALEWLITDLEQNHNTTTQISVNGKRDRLPPETELTVFRIAQEVLSNIRRHSKATEVTMSLDFGKEAVTLVLSDNGRGFTVPERASDLAQTGRLGIIGMKERARLIGGILLVESGPNRGTKVTLIVPRSL